MPIIEHLAAMAPELTAWRRDLHAHPELLFDTHRTGQFVADKLRQFGCDEVVTGIGRTGVVGVIHGRVKSAKRVVALRADMDALPIQEASQHNHISRTPGVMHACGHDGHTTMLLGASCYLAETRNFAGTAVVIFQPAEEGGGGGREMCEAGVMERFGIQEVYGMHNWPSLEVGQFAIRSGPFFAASNQLEIRVIGKGGHAAKPHETIDPTVVAAQVITALQTVASRSADPIDSIVISITAFTTSSQAYNVIPAEVFMKGTMRTMTRAMRDLGIKRVSEIVQGIGNAFGARINLEFRQPYYPPTVNHAQETQHAIAAAQRVAGKCIEAPMIMCGEDFAYMLQKRPGAYILLGNGDSADVHHPEYDFNDAAIPTGCSWWVEIIEGRMPVTEAP